jgi:glycosyltransferase involved in cell wall biosynthesis
MGHSCSIYKLTVLSQYGIFMKKLPFSVLLPIYDRAELQFTIEKCVQAIANNSVCPDEVVIVIDGPLSWDLISQLREYDRCMTIRYLQLPSRMGLTNALNIGLRECRYNIVARVDADDYCMVERFEKQLLMYSQGYKVIGSNIQEIDENGNFLGQRIVPEFGTDILEFARRRNPFNHMSMMYDKLLVLSAGGYPDIFLKEDYALWVKLLSLGHLNVINIQECLMLATTGAGFYRRRTSWKILLNEYRMQVYIRRHLGKSYFLMMCDLFLKYWFFFTPVSLKRYAYKKFLRN